MTEQTAPTETVACMTVMVTPWGGPQKKTWATPLHLLDCN